MKPASTATSLLAAALTLVLMGGCAFNVVEVEFESTARYEGDDWDTFAASLSNGSISVTGVSGSTIEVIGRFEAFVLRGDESDFVADVDLSLSNRNGLLTLSLDYPDDSAETVTLNKLVVHPPSEARLVLETSNGSITASGLAGAVTAETSNGSVRVSTEGAVSLRSSNGDVTATTGGGGSVDTSNGEIDVRITEPDISALVATTSNGDVTVRLPTNAGFDLDLETSNGDIVIRDVNLAIDGTAYAGPIRGGGPMIRVRTSNGDIVIR
jgi:hypothetical protein